MAIKVMRQFYEENPLRKQNPSLPSPAYHLENTRRRGDTLLSQADTVSSTAGTPMEVDRASRSPGLTRVNGETSDAKSHTQDGASQAKSEENDYAPRSPSKRRALDEGEADQGRADKRARLSEDEGELIED